MKTKRWIACILIMIVALTGCNSAGSQTATTTAQAETTSQTETTTLTETTTQAEITVQLEDTTNEKSEEVVLYIARHGKTMLNTTDRSQGWIDAPLTPAGIEVAQALGNGLKLENITFDSVYTSDSGRAIETAEIVLDTMGLDLTINKDKRLREFNFGSFEGMPNEEMQMEIAAVAGLTMDEWIAHMNEVGFPQAIAEFADIIAEVDKEKVDEGINWPAEDITSIRTRLQTSLDEIVQESMNNGDTNVLVVSHGMSIATFAAMIDENVEMPASGLQNASITKVTYKDGTYTLEAVNDMSYVEKGQQQ